MPRSTTTLIPNNTSNAAFRAWGSAINAALAAMGLIKTADTGQIDWTTVAAAGANGFAGYEIWRFNDALQATKPVFFRIDYGSGSGSPNGANIKVQGGTGSSGAGAITGQIGTAMSTYSVTDTVARNCYFSGDTNRFSMALFLDATNALQGLVFSIERTKDAAGADNTDGFVIVLYGNSGNNWPFNWQYIPFVGTILPFENANGLAVVNGATTNAVEGANVIAVPLYPLYYVMRNPLIGAIAYHSTDIARETEQDISMYGVARKYMTTGFGNSKIDRANTNPNLKMAMRYEV